MLTDLTDRQRRSLQTCHLPKDESPLVPVPRTQAYVPELAERLEHDRNLTDGARRCARVLAAYIYRRNREARRGEITVTWLSKALGRCRRSVQRYLRQLERAGYIEVHILPSGRTRMSIGLLIQLLGPLLPLHWPGRHRKPGVTAESQNYSFRYKGRPIPRPVWALRCMDGVFRSLCLALDTHT